MFSFSCATADGCINAHRALLRPWGNLKTVNILRLYMRVIGLLAPERKLAITLTLANLALAGVYFLEPMLFGQVVDALSAPGAAAAPRLIALWALAGFGGVVASVWVSLHADRLAHRRRLAAI